MEMVIVDFPILLSGSDHHELGGVNRPINGIYCPVDNMETKTASLNKESWIKIDGDHVIVKEKGEEKTYPLIGEDIELTVDEVFGQMGIYNGVLCRFSSSLTPHMIFVLT